MIVSPDGDVRALAIEASGTPTSVATAIAARALSTLCSPGRFSVTGKRVTLPLTRTTSKSI